MPKDWGEKPNCAPRTERLAPPRDMTIADEFNYDNGTDDGICQQCDGTGESHNQLCKGCLGKGYLIA